MKASKLNLEIADFILSRLPYIPEGRHTVDSLALVAYADEGLHKQSWQFRRYQGVARAVLAFAQDSSVPLEEHLKKARY
jgi:hypothetical protein